MMWPPDGSLDSSVTTKTTLRAGRPSFNSRRVLWDFFSSPPRRDRIWESNRLLSNGYRG